jgi:Uma2 family endonuclease
VCETVSPSSARHDRILKARIYRQPDVAWYWLVDPVNQTIEVLQGEGERWLVYLPPDNEADHPRLPPFEAIALDLSWLWEGSAP